MHFDPRKPHGIVFNHPHIRYEQNGKSYDAAGRLCGLEEEPEDDVPQNRPALEPGQRDFGVESAREFLSNVLAEGPLRRSELFRIAEANNQPWDKVKQAFEAMQGEVFNRKNSLYWKLKVE